MAGILKRLWRPGRRKWVVAGGLLLFFVFTIGSVEITSQSWFCNSCHIMNPYYSSWKTGSHKGVKCVACHISPGVNNFVAAKLNGLGQVVDDVLSRTSTKPSASVSQFSCTRSGCHSVEVLNKTVNTTGTYKFRHDKHIGLETSGIKLACGSCHSHVKGDQHFAVNTNTCITCHFAKADGGPLASPLPPPTGGMFAPVLRLALRDGHTAPLDSAEGPPGAEKVPPNTCNTCHDAPKGVFERNGLKVNHAEYLAYGASCESCHRGTTAVPDPISDGRCLQCHNFGVEKTLPIEEMHRVHNEGRHKIECFSCHGTMLHGPTAQTASLGQFDCQQCHVGQHAIQRSTYLTASAAAKAHGDGRTVSPMFLAHVACTGCHVKPRELTANPTSGATVNVATPEACDACHKPGLGAQMIPLWQRTTHALFDSVSDSLKAAEAEGVDPASLEEVRRVLETIRVDGSWGVHNPLYTQRLLEQARDSVADARSKKKGEPR